MKKQEKQNESEECPEGNDPLYCDLCKEAENIKWKQRQEFRRKLHGLA